MVYKDKEYHKNYYLRNKDTILKKHKTYKEKNKDKIQIDNKKYKEENKDKIKLSNKKYHKNNIERYRNIQKKYDQKLENKEKKIKYNKKHKEERQKYHVKYDEKYRKEHPEQCKIHTHKRRTKIKGNGGSYTIEEIKKLRKESKGICPGWNREPHYVGEENLEIDHIIPISKGGNSNIENIQLLCKSCNCSKGNKVKQPVTTP